MDQPKTYVRTDEHGVMRVGNTRVMLDSIVAAFEHGHSAETIREQFPSLSLEEVYGAIAYYLAFPQQVSEYLLRQGALWESWRTDAAERPSRVVERLRAARGAEATEVS